MSMDAELIRLALQVRKLDADFNAIWTQDRLEELDRSGEYGKYDSACFDLWQAQADLAVAMADRIAKLIPFEDITPE